MKYLKEDIKCENCQEIIPAGKKVFETQKHEFCSRYCGTLWASKTYYHKNKNNPEFIEARKKNIQQWYIKNKETHKKNVLEHYKKNKKKWDEREFIRHHKDKILKHIPKTCQRCGKEEIPFLHKDYSLGIKKPKLKYGKDPKLKIENEQKMEVYSKAITGYCSLLCLRRHNG